LGDRDIFELSDQEAEEKQVTEYLLTKIENILFNSTQLILDRVYQAIGFDAIEDEILRHWVVACLSQPMSKSDSLKTTSMHNHLFSAFFLQHPYKYLNINNNILILGVAKLLLCLSEK